MNAAELNTIFRAERSQERRKPIPEPIRNTLDETLVIVCGLGLLAVVSRLLGVI
jgi:hypothetical protein